MDISILQSTVARSVSEIQYMRGLKIVEREISDEARVLRLVQGNAGERI